MFKSAVTELSQWADQCRRWADSSRTKEQRLDLKGLERILSDAASQAEGDSESGSLRPPANS